MSDPVTLRVVRPYDNETELLEAEAWTIDVQRVILIGERPQKRGTLVRVEIVLSTGDKILRAEGKVVGMAKRAGDRPGGLEVRLKKYGASTKQFIERAMQAAGAEPVKIPARSRPVLESLSETDSSPDDEPDSVPAEARSEPGAAAADESGVEEIPELVSQVEQIDEIEPPSRPKASRPSVELAPGPDRSGVRTRVIEPPANREALLERLRERARRIANARIEND